MDFRPKKAVIDMSPQAIQKEVGREDAYQFMTPAQKRAIGHRVVERDLAARELERAEKEIDNSFKKFRKKNEDPNDVNG